MTAESRLTDFLITSGPVDISHEGLRSSCCEQLCLNAEGPYALTRFGLCVQEGSVRRGFPPSRTARNFYLRGRVQSRLVHGRVWASHHAGGRFCPVPRIRQSHCLLVFVSGELGQGDVAEELGGAVIAAKGATDARADIRWHPCWAVPGVPDAIGIATDTCHPSASNP